MQKDWSIMQQDIWTKPEIKSTNTSNFKVKKEHISCCKNGRDFNAVLTEPMQIDQRKALCKRN